MEAAYGSGLVAALLGVGLLAGCAGPSATPVAELPPGSPAPVIAEAPPPLPIEVRLIPMPALQPPSKPVPYIENPNREATFGHLACSGESVQGGYIVCRTDAQAWLELDGRTTAFADVNGIAVIGVPRNQKSPAIVTFAHAKPAPEFKSRADIFPVRASVVITKRHDDISVIEMECSKIAPQTDDQKRRAEESWVKKDLALRSFHGPYGPLMVDRPVVATEEQYSISSFGKTRTYQPKTRDCEPTVNVHNGTDIAVPVGTEIRAPMAGTVLLAEPDLYFEGGAVFLDLGYGLVSVTMHMSRIDVKAGDIVEQGHLLGLSGATGRVTGPHVHWAIKYRDIATADRSGDFWIDPMLLLGIEPPQ